MAETAVAVLIDQLAPLIANEVKLLGGVREEVAEIRRTLESIKGLLKDADRRQQSEEGVKVWVKQVREVAYDIENVIDEFLLRMGRPHGRQGCAVFLRRCTSMFRHLMARHRIGSEIQSIKVRLQSISERRSEFSLVSSTAEDAPSSHSSVHDPRLTAPLLLEESEVVGIRKPREDLNKLLRTGSPKPMVVSVLGMGGLGKTTLVRRVYQNEEVRKIFNSFAWVTVSQSFSPEELLKGMLKEFVKTEEGSSCKEINNMSYVELAESVRSHLHDKRYVVVLDDVWNIRDWENLEPALPKNELKSRIIVTTRKHEVASYCSKSSEFVYKLEPLPETEARTLFCRKVFNSNVCPPELKESSERILEICGGLPLAVVTIGGLLLTKNKTSIEWALVQRNLSIELQHNDVFDNMKRVLWLGYDDLAYHLKPCFLYFSIFPQDYPIERGQIIRTWIAEGFVKPIQGMTLEQIAEGYLNELVHRSLVEVVKFNTYGRVNQCRVHDLMHDLIFFKSKEQSFISWGSGHETELPDRVHRLSIHSGNCISQSCSLSEVRSLHIFVAEYMPDLSRFRMLKVLNLSGLPLEKFPDGIVSLFHLRYLNLRKTLVKEIPNSIGKLRNLQTLDLKFTYVSELPIGILHCRHLRLILAYHFYFENSVSFVAGVKIPGELGKLTSLHKLGTLELDGSKQQAQELSKLTQLRTLGIHTVKEQDWVALRESVSGMKHLETLWINTDREDKPLDVKFLSSLSPSLRVVCLRGYLHMLPEVTESFEKLVKIDLVSSRLLDDPLEAFGHLPNLAFLELENAYDGECMRSGTKSYPGLKLLCIGVCGSLKHIEIERGAMPKLEFFGLSYCPSLQKVPDGIENLTKLKELNLHKMPRNLIRRIEQNSEDWETVKHIPLIKHFYERGGMSYWEVLSLGT